MSSAAGGAWVNERGTRQSGEKCERALREGVPIEGTPAERYLVEQRKLQHPFPADLRYLANARTGEGALIAPLTVDGKVAGVQACFIDPFGRKSVVSPSRETWKLDEKESPNAIFDLPCRGDDNGEIAVCDGYEDSLTVATFGLPRSKVIGLPGQWALKHLHFPEGTKILVVADGDPAGSRGAVWLQQGVDRLILSGCEVRLTPIPPVHEPKLDANQILIEAGVDGLRNWLGQAVLAKLSDDGEIRRLAKLRPLDYGRERIQAAKRLGLSSVKFLDQAVEGMRKTLADEAAASNDDFLDINETRPWGDEVNGADLLDEITKTVRSFIVMTAEQSWAVALWAVFTWCFDIAAVAPKLWIKSAEKRSGKSRLLEVLCYICRRPLGGSRMSPAVFYRLIEARNRPTLLLDEFDAFAADNEDFRGLLDAGFDNTEMSKVWTCMGDDHEPTPFSVFTPQAIAGIGKIKDTVADRCIKIELERKARHEKVARLRRRDTAPLVELAQQCARWAKDNIADLTKAEPDIPVQIHDRAADAWELLIAIADQAGEHWGKQASDIGRARKAALWISGDGEYPIDEDSLGIQLLHDIRAALYDKLLRRNPKAKSVSSADVASWLIGMEDQPWSSFRSRDPISQHQLASLLRPFKIRPGLIKDGKTVYRGYRIKTLQSAFDRYLPPIEQDPEDRDDDALDDDRDANVYAHGGSKPPPQSVAPLPSEDFCGSQGDFDPLPNSPGNTLKTPGNTSKRAKGNGVALQTPQIGGSAEHTSTAPSDESSISAISDNPVPSIADQARQLRALNLEWTVEQIAHKLHQPLNRISRYLGETAPAAAPRTAVRPPEEVLALSDDWVAERQAMLVRKLANTPLRLEAGLPIWSDNAVYRDWFTCNPRRQDDITTVFIRENIAERYGDDPYLWLMLCIARVVNWPDTLLELMATRGAWPGPDFSIETYAKVIGDRLERGVKTYVRAYRVGNDRIGMIERQFAKHEVMLDLLRKPGVTMQEVHHELCQVKNWGAKDGGFLSYQPLVDMRFSPLLSNAPDRSSWGVAGPGVQEFVRRMHGLPFADKPGKSGTFPQDKCLDYLRGRYADLQKKFPGIDWDFSDTANVCCESNKICKIVFGEPHNIRRYHPKPIAAAIPGEEPTVTDDGDPNLIEIDRVVEILRATGDGGMTASELYGRHKVYGRTLEQAKQLGRLKHTTGSRWVVTP